MAYIDLFRALQCVPKPTKLTSPLGDGRWPGRLSTDGVWLIVDVRCYPSKDHWWSDLYVREDRAWPVVLDLDITCRWNQATYYLVRAMSLRHDTSEGKWALRRTKPIDPWKHKQWNLRTSRKRRYLQKGRV